MKSFFKASVFFSTVLLLSACSPISREDSTSMVDESFKIFPISHATAVLEWDSTVIYSDPVGGAQAFASYPAANIVFVTDIHGDHLNVETLEEILTEESILIVPEAVNELLPETLNGIQVVLANGEKTEQLGFTIEAIAMYNLPVSEESRHAKGRGNGYVFEKNDKRVYFSGDTADIPEMRALEDIDVAFVCMNLPYTMDVEEAADAVLAFKPRQVYPYHYRTPEGFSDVMKFKQIVNDGDADIEVIQLDWYSSQ